MATLVLSAAGAAAGGALGGSVLGLSAGMLGRAGGAIAGRMIDQQLMGGGSEVVEHGRVERFRLTGAGEGTPIPRTFGRMRLPGQVIWASDFLERQESETRSGGKGGGGRSVTTTTYSYSVSLAIALCEGEITSVGRIWADGQEIPQAGLTMRVYHGKADQNPDPKISAIEGAHRTPAFRGTAYVVIEDLELAQFGNRVPQFSFEVIRQEQPEVAPPEGTMAQAVRGVALIPGTGEYTLATTPVHYVEGPGRKTPANVFGTGGRTDFLSSMDALDAELKNCDAVSLIVCWFAGDLRCDRAELRPKVEHKRADGAPLAWSVAGLDRVSAQVVPTLDGRPVYGGTPTDISVVEAIRELKARGKHVLFYPFILMDQMEGNGLPDPWTGAASQPPLPWRGRITSSVAAGQPSSVDGTPAAEAEVATFFGTARPGDYTLGDGTVSYSGPDEWSMRRFILHYAALCTAAGGVDSFCIGTEMRGLTQIRGPGDSFPAVAAFRDLASDVRAIVGPHAKISYAADWSEYFGYTPQDGSGDHFFHLDPLWADNDIDFIGIDNYMRISDWRPGEDHLDAQVWESIYDIDYLQSNIEGGEGYDWYYPDAGAAAAQLRVPITDGAYDEPWVFRYKDIRAWWSNPHFDRKGGVRQAAPTAWVPQSKPIWFTELGCAAIESGTNQPNKFLDPKSSESLLPRGSTGARDDLVQMQYLRATLDYWSRSENNPVSPLYAGRMLDMDRAFVWAWDARPYPWFPGLNAVWSDGPNYLRGHWLNGRTGSQLLSTVVREICADAGLEDPDVSRLYGLVRGYALPRVESARAALEPLMLTFGFDAFERAGQLVFANRAGRATARTRVDRLARSDGSESAVTTIRAAQTGMSGRVRLTYVAADASFETATIEAALPGRETDTAADREVNLVLTAAEARTIAERSLSEARIGRETAQFALPPSSRQVGPGDVLGLEGADGVSLYRIDRCEEVLPRMIEATRVEPSVYVPGRAVEEIPQLRAAEASVPPTPVFLDMPQLSLDDDPVAPYLAVAAQPWPGRVAVFESGQDANYRLNRLVDRAATIGVTRSALPRAAPGRIDRGPALRIEISGGVLASATREGLLAGENAMAIGDEAAGVWEVFQFERADLVAPDTYDLSGRLRGQLGTDTVIPDAWPAGTTVVLLDAGVGQIAFTSERRGLERHYRVGPAQLPYTDDTFVHRIATFNGNGLRPYAPVHVRARRTAAGDHEIGWIRRTRVDGDLWNLADVPLGEASERYRLRVRRGDVVLREIDVAGAPRWTYSVASRAHDGVVSPYEVDVAQISDRFGPGHFRKVTINV